MKIRLEKASDWAYNKAIEINTLKELIDFINNEKHSLVIEPSCYHKKDDYDTVAIIYDDYLE